MKRNAFFQLVHKEDGIFLKSYPAVDGGEPLKADDVLSYLVAKKWNDVPTEQIKVFVEKAAHLKVLCYVYVCKCRDSD